MEIKRTPDHRFENLPGWDFRPRYVDVDSTDGGTLRVHYVDEGAGPVVLLLHGEPSWAYLYRKMIPVLVREELRAVAVDLVGFGRSDKPVERSDYTYARHVAWINEVVLHLDLTDVTLFGQDWGGLIGLRLVAEDPDRYARVVAANTFLPTGDMPLGDAFHRWKDYSQRVEHFDVPFLIDRGCVMDLSDEVKAAYDAPFPDDSYKAGARQFPNIVPASPDDPAAAANRAAWEVLQEWKKPFLTAFSDSDPITRGADLLLQGLIPGTGGLEHPTIADAGHYLQEDKGEELARAVVEFIKST